MGNRETKCCARNDAADDLDDGDSWSMEDADDVDPMGIRLIPGKISKAQLGLVKKELSRLRKKPGMRVPVRSFMTDQPYQWRHGGPPDYDLADYSYLTGKSMKHAEGSLDQIVEDLVKTWEFERSHKLNAAEHKTVDQAKFRIGANGNKMFDNVEANQVGNYNVLLDGVKEELWAKNQSWESTHEHFKDAFATFPWEVLKVFSGPPTVGFSWRHWAHFTGTYKDRKGKGELLNMFGWATATVTDDLKLQDVHVYYQPEDFLLVMEGKKSASELNSDSLLSDGMAACPVTGQQGKCGRC